MTHHAQRYKGGTQVNVGKVERWLSMASGAAILLKALRRGFLGSTALALAGGYLFYRGKTGRCSLYQSLGVSTAGKEEGIEVKERITVNRPVAEVYRFWRNLENLPRFMNHLDEVRVIDGKRSHWVARTPGGIKVEWESQIIEERENEYLRWRSLPESDIDNEGIVKFIEAPGGRGTEVEVDLFYYPPGGTAGAAVISLLNTLTFMEIKEELRRFKQVVEAGEAPTTEGQPSAAVGE